eukprot:TRINITY_DN3882_c0_g2_i1.p3 TRINITY_DN3882_c0_g2~~TRINITY_DN3882_c0_g2_i1.p3  ORF type:complete len:122 (+),score=6.02 TRINITY_DN3882_c0_g2_i1:377-742(+)
MNTLWSGARAQQGSGEQWPIAKIGFSRCGLAAVVEDCCLPVCSIAQVLQIDSILDGHGPGPGLVDDLYRGSGPVETVFQIVVERLLRKVLVLESTALGGEPGIALGSVKRVDAVRWVEVSR